MNLIRHILKDFQKRQNLDIYITIIIAIVVSVLGIFQVTDLSVIISAVLATLALVSISLLVNRRENDEIQKAISKIETKGVLAENFLTREDELQLPEKDFTSANTIFLSGISLTRTIRKYEHILDQRLATGASIRIIIVDPTLDSIVEEIALRSDGTVGSWRSRLQAAQQAIHSIPKIRGNKGKLEIGYLPYTPSFGIVLIDPYEPHGFCFVELYHHEKHVPSPAFKLRASDDPKWYEFFREQYEILWKRCSVEQLPKTEETTL